MSEITRVSLENEMDVVVAHKRMMGVAQFFSLTLSTQATIATAVAEVSRVVIDKTDQGFLSIHMDKDNGKYFLTGRISFPAVIPLKVSDEGLKYAQVLVPEFKYERSGDLSVIIVSIGIPRSFKITAPVIRDAAEHFRNLRPSSAYEQLKARNTALNQRALEKEEELRYSRYLDEKKNEFISIASHELKTPLTTIIAFTKLALNTSAAEGSEKVSRYLQKIDNQVKKLHLLIQQLLDISKIESGKLDYDMHSVEWNGFMTEVFPVLEHMVPSHHLTWQSVPAAALVSIDALRIEQVLTNLVNNAAKYSEPNTTIDISCLSDKEMLTIRVRDEGIGISDQNVNKIFEKYFRESAVIEKYSGFGMGLYISSGIIREHKGTIWAEKNTDAGSSFYFTLPIHPRAATGAAV